MRSEAARRQHWALADSRIAEKSNPAAVHVDWLIDNSAAYDGLLWAVRDARHSIWISQLAFDADCTAYASDKSGSGANTDDNLLDAILATSEEHRVSVRILLNSTPLLDTKRPLLKFLAGCKRDASLVEVRGISRFPQLLHAKIVVIDERLAFLVGSPFVNGYWDAQSHRPVDYRRPCRELGGRPVHDVSVALRGNAVRDLAATFLCLWNGAGHQEPNRKPPSNGPSVDSNALDAQVRSSGGRPAAERCVEVVTTEPRGVRGSDNPGSRQTLNALLDGIRCARSLIYIEHQYLSSRPVAEALRAALDRQHALEIVLLLNQNPDVTAYRRWQDARLAETGLLDHPRVGVFALWSTGARHEADAGINQVFIHSKVVIVDDEWAMVGSANLDGVSLDSYGDDFSGRLGRLVFRDVRNFDVGVVLRTELKSGSAANPIYELRRRLWVEHLGHHFSEPPQRSSVADWRAAASRNIAALNAPTESRARDLEGSFILPYSTGLSPRSQLADLGVRPSASIDLHFDPGWLELNFSPNWIRNMFL